LTVTVIAAFALPSKLADPLACPARDIVRAVASFVADPALPVIAVCAGWTCPSRANFPLSVPTLAVPAVKGVALLAMA
jgi:hypothetical protein